MFTYFSEEMKGCSKSIQGYTDCKPASDMANTKCIEESTTNFLCASATRVAKTKNVQAAAETSANIHVCKMVEVISCSLLNYACRATRVLIQPLAWTKQ